MTLDISKLDFDEIKDNLKTFLKSQTEFNDFDFDGAAINVILDVLAYNTHYMGMYSNMALSEMFLHSASRRNSVISRAKEMNYFPRQISAAKAQIRLSIDITLDGNEPTSVFIPKGSIFNSVDSNNSNTVYKFVTTQDEYLYDVDTNGLYYADIYIVEGKFLSESFVYNISLPDTVFTLQNKNIDDNYLSVIVNGDTGTTWSRGNDITLSDSTTKYYFVSEESNDRIGIYFGDGVVSAQPSGSDDIVVQHLVTSGDASNGAKVFSLKSGPSEAISLFTTTLISAASGGDAKESTESIKLVAPKFYQAQNRAITNQDFRSILLNKFPNISAISVWGGEENIPPRYGYVYICIRPTTDGSLTVSEIDKIETILKPYKMVSIIPIVVDPEYLYIDVSVDTDYSKSNTTLSAGNIKSLILDKVNSYFSDDINDFNSVLRTSVLATIIDNSEPSILGTELSYSLIKVITGVIGSTSYSVEFNNKLTPGSVLSDSWVVNGIDYQVVDDGLGYLWLYTNAVKGGKSVGSVDYTSGLVSFVINPLTSAYINLVAKPAKTDILVVRDKLLTVRNISVSVNA